MQGSIPPSDFIPIAEETRLIVPLGEWVLQEACKAALQWPKHIRISVNVSAVQLEEPSKFVATVNRVLKTSGLDPNRLELEITETAILHSNKTTELALLTLQGIGVRVAMDDFGTGYSSLRSLQDFRFERLKIDRSFISNITTSTASRNIVRAVSGLATGLGILTTVEGVETVEQLALVEAKGCDEVQGFLFSKPLPLRQVTHLIHRDVMVRSRATLSVA